MKNLTCGDKVVSLLVSLLHWVDLGVENREADITQVSHGFAGRRQEAGGYIGKCEVAVGFDVNGISQSLHSNTSCTTGATTNLQDTEFRV